MIWWLDKGIDGFRVDAISHIKKEPGLKDMPNPDNLKYVSSFDKHMNINGIQDLLKEIKEETFSKYDIVTVGEANGVNSDEALDWVGEKNGKFSKESEKALAMMYFMQKGTPFIYQGQELGMTNVVVKSIEEVDDIQTVNLYYDKLNYGVTKEEALELVNSVSRDNARTPMQWDDSEYAGFSDSKPWIRVNENYKYINVKSEEEDSDSILNFYKKMINLRREHLCLIYVKYELILENSEEIFAYTRTLDDEKFIVITNLSNKEVNYSFETYKLKYKNLILSNYEVNEHCDYNEFKLRPYEARLYRVKNK